MNPPRNEPGSIRRNGQNDRVGAYGGHTARSIHNNGVNVCLGDASVRFVGDTIDQDVWGNAISIADRKTTELPK